MGEIVVEAKKQQAKVPGERLPKFLTENRILILMILCCVYLNFFKLLIMIIVSVKLFLVNSVGIF